MVFFTCGHCGESLKKAGIDKHYLFKCHAVPMLTCVDCLKDFKGQEYEAHTKCMTENERYSAKGYVEKESSGKGEKKQKMWSSCIQSLLEKHDLQKEEREMIQIISQYDNVPRKKAKFINFIKNACKHLACNTKLVDNVWELVSKSHDSSLPQNGNANLPNGDNSNVDKPEILDKENKEDADIKPAVKKSKRKLKNDEDKEAVVPKKLKASKNMENGNGEIEDATGEHQLPSWIKVKSTNDLQTTITQILSQQNDNRITRDDLQDMVLKSYIDYKAFRKVLKKELKKLSNVKFEGDEVILIADTS